MIVVDASTWVDFLTGRVPDQYRRQILQEDPASPPHVDFEVGSALARLQRRELLPPGAAKALVREFSLMPFRRERVAEDQVRAFDVLDNATYADALYIALAVRLQCRLLTRDSGMAECARLVGVETAQTSPAAGEQEQ